MVKMIVRIDGMRCGMYEAHICGAVRRELPVKKVAASRRKGQAVLLMNENIPAQRVRDVIEATGRRVLSMTSQSCEQKGLFAALRKYAIPATDLRCPDRCER